MMLVAKTKDLLQAIFMVEVQIRVQPESLKVMMKLLFESKNIALFMMPLDGAERLARKLESFKLIRESDIWSSASRMKYCPSALNQIACVRLGVVSLLMILALSEGGAAEFEQSQMQTLLYSSQQTKYVLLGEGLHLEFLRLRRGRGWPTNDSPIFFGCFLYLNLQNTSLLRVCSIANTCLPQIILQKDCFHSYCRVKSMRLANLVDSFWVRIKEVQFQSTSKLLIVILSLNSASTPQWLKFTKIPLNARLLLLFTVIRLLAPKRNTQLLVTFIYLQVSGGKAEECEGRQECRKVKQGVDVREKNIVQRKQRRAFILNRN